MGEGRSDRFSTRASTRPVRWDSKSMGLPAPAPNIVARRGACKPPARDCLLRLSWAIGQALRKALRSEQAALIRIAVAAAAARLARGGGLRLVRRGGLGLPPRAHRGARKIGIQPPDPPCPRPPPPPAARRDPYRPAAR